MITKFTVQTKDGKVLASREAFMIMHPARGPDCSLSEGDVVELEEGFFVLNNDLHPMQLATQKQIDLAQK